MTREPAPDHTLSDYDASHRTWDRDLAPALTVEDGEVVRFSCRPASGDAIGPETTTAEAVAAPFPGHLLTGPVEVAGAAPGDVIAVEFLAIETGEWGHTLVHPNSSDRGLLSAEFDEPALYHWNLGTDTAVFDHRSDIEVPLEPFPGTVGLAPAEPGQHRTIPPRTVGGNVDVQYLTAGTTLFLPVDVEGGLLSIGDGHAAQGDGEVCVTALEAPLTVTARLTVHSEIDIDGPTYQMTVSETTGATFATTGIAADVYTASAEAIRSMVSQIGGERVTREEAYVLCSVAADLSINEVVNEQVVVSAQIPNAVLPDGVLPSTS